MAAKPKARLQWVDTVKATSVILVVFMHVTQSLVFAAGDSAVATFFSDINVFLEPFRMPIFFVVSGLLASSAVNRPWAQTRSRTIGIGYLFLLWHFLMTVFTFSLNLLVGSDSALSLAETLRQFVVQLVLPPGGYWYLWALVVYFVIARLTRELPTWQVLGVAAAINLARPVTVWLVHLVTGPFEVSNMMDAASLNIVYFLVGVRLAAEIKDFSRTERPALLQLTGTAAVAGSMLRVLVPGIQGWSFLPLAALWITFGILAAAQLSKHPAVARFGAYVGPRTMPIFALQFPAIFVVYKILGGPLGDVLAGSPILQIVYPIALTAALAIGSLWIYEKAQGTAAQHLFKAPPQLTAAPAPARTPQPVHRPVTTSVVEGTGPIPVLV